MKTNNRNGHLGMKCSNIWNLHNSLGQKRYRKNKRKEDLKKYAGLIKILHNDEVFNGLMLSDGFIAKRSVETQNTRFGLLQSEKNEQFVLKVQQHFQDLGIESSIGKYFIKDKRKAWKNHWQINFYTKYSVIFTELRKRWYIGNKKIIPKNLKLTPKTLAYLFMGDGFSSWMNGKWKTVSIGICCESFSKRNIILLKQKLEKLELSNIKIRNRGTNQYRIAIEKNSETTKFMKLIDPYIIPIFRYKIKYPKLEARIK